jgi:Zn finger protein HypA/HybF involved in hydrogenase expression
MLDMLTDHPESVVPEREMVRAMLQQALAEARSRGAGRVTHLHLVVYAAPAELEARLRQMVHELSLGTPAEGAQVVLRRAPSRFICWNCCGLRFQSEEAEAVCPNCGHEAWLIPAEVTFALERTELG